MAQILQEITGVGKFTPQPTYTLDAPKDRVKGPDHKIFIPDPPTFIGRCTTIDEMSLRVC